MKKLIFIALLMSSFLVFNNSIIHAQMYFSPVLTHPYYFNNYPALYGYSWGDPFLNLVFSRDWNYKVVNWPYNSFSYQPLSYALSFEPDTLTISQSRILAKSNQSSSFSIFPQPVTMGGVPPIISEEVKLSNILNPESPLYYLSPASPYYGFQLPDRGPPPFPREPRPKRRN